MKKFSESNPLKGYMIMEYLDNLKPVHVYNNVTTNAVKEILRAKAVIEAMSLRFTPEEKKVFSENALSELFGEFFRKEVVGDMMKIFRQFDGGKLAERADEMEKIIPDLMDFKWADQLADELGMQRVLCHGDLWSMNVLWRPKGDDFAIAALIDFQTAHMGCPANDLVRVFSACLSGKDRQEHWEELVEVFYGYLMEEVGNMKMPYTLEQLKESYRRFMPTGAFMIVPMIGPMFEILCKSPDEEQRKKNQIAMNLYTPASGLFGTHVTWNNVEEDMHRELGTSASFGPNKTATNIGEAKGFMSRIVLIDPDWQHKDKELPQKFIVKIVTQLALQQMADTAKKMNAEISPESLAVMESYLKRLHNTEVTVYNHLLKLPEGKVPLAKIYYTKKFSESNPVKGYIIMEYLDKINPVYIYEDVTPKAIKETLRAKAVMEAMSLKFTPEEKQEFNDKHFSGFFGNFFTREMMGSIVAMFRQLGDSKIAEKADELEKVLPDLMDLPWADQLAEEIGMQRVLCHGDLWLMNILWRPDCSTAALIDYQAWNSLTSGILKFFTSISNAHMGCPANDLVRLFTTSLSGKDRQQHWEELVEQFHEYLKEEAAGLEMPYTLEQIKESYRRFLPMGAFMSLPMAGHIFEIVCKNPDEEQKKKYLGIVVEKISCLLDDILYYHERKMKIRKGEQHA
ncbi:hypothetical protein ANCCAN_10374 [Ancylostoma caninum]|uniref:CHK kinase-like domain-containing protein n=1 Tax=Ancylostoma caninum TaxID=29170 RepID=A0A368GGU0_ANCCA|nr:hypothetical protein ANCCAN_10374 [Ancylostoma caninum]